MKYFLISVGLGGFAFTVFKEKPPGDYFFACTALMITVLGSVLSNDKRPGPFKILGAMMVATAGQQLIFGYLASEMNRLWLVLQFIALQTLVVGAMLTPKRKTD